ncbi:hypothetical protein K435DRAFT_830546 [Dendrothele bispora CBS 962.96]|uniref:Uncharacterized protein n=1 Tax=Dendrothele bispora (strain CBS 962.96) TaxID=1314807 RepID=A0A4S8LIM8_DENBC|nr:hypothetical protein K435DRAFT_830546 [Dendrothele bispora CBS 962.96]
MDELLHHCLRELAFDGDLGCNVSRLSDFINDFYTHSLTTRTQRVDDAFCAFVWSLVVQQPTVRVGTIPDGIESEVWIAPQTSAKRKANAKGEKHVEMKPPELNIVPDAKSRSLADLQQEYGDKLRIASDPDAIYAAITGSHIRFPKMSPMVYSALQIITRGRDDGVTVVQLGQQSKYDQKTCFYLVKQLTDLNLVAKVRRGGVGTHFVIHRYFFERSPSWKAIREEENSAELARKGADQPKVDVPDEEREEKDKEVESLNFTPIDARHLSSLPLVRARVVKLLKASRNHMHVSSNMLLTIGFSNPTKTDRRFFQSRIRELVQQGILEKVIVPSTRRKSPKGATVLCLRLVDENGSNDDKDNGVVVLQPQDDREEEDYFQSGVKMNMTIHKQIIDLLEESGTNGMTLNELSNALCQFDKRTIELLLARAERFPPPPHLSDLGIAGLMETSGRERRHRYYTVSAYRTLVAHENLDQSTAGYSDVDFGSSRSFMPVDADAFYDDESSLHVYQDSFKEDISGKGKKSTVSTPASASKRAKSKKRVRDEDGESTIPRPKGKKRKIAGPEDLETDGAELSISVGRRKDKRVAAEDADTQDGDAIPSISRKRGRTTKSAVAPAVPGALLETPSAAPEPKKRGRPSRKSQAKATATSNTSTDTPAVSSTQKRQRSPMVTPENEEPSEARLPPRKRGRASRSRIWSETPDDIGLARDNPSTNLGVAGIEPRSDEAEQPAIASLPSNALSEEDSLTDETAGVDMAAPSNGGPSSGRQTQASLVVPALSSPQPASTDPTQSDHDARSLQEIAISLPARKPASAEHGQIVPPSIQVDNAQSGSSRQMVIAQPRARVNVSNLRRENELLKVVELLGGIVNIQTKELYDTHTTLLETLSSAGESTSSPVGTRTDKRTVTATFNSLESRGKIKQLTTSIPTHLGMSRPTVIVYLPTVEQEKLNQFLTDLSRSVPPPIPSPSGRKISEPLDYGADPIRLTKNALPLQLLQMEKPGSDNTERWSKNAARAEQLFALDRETIRDVLLTERTTVGQYHGTIVAKMLRARELHLTVLNALETNHPSPQIVSHVQKIFNLNFLSHDLPLHLYCKLVPPLTHSDELAQFMSTETGLNTIVKDLPNNLLNTLQIGRSRARARLLDTLDILRCLNVVTPLQPSISSTPWLTCEAKEKHPIGFDKDPLNGWSASTPMTAPNHWVLNDTAPVYHWARSETDPPFLQDMPISSSAVASRYWSALQDACTNKQLITINGGGQSTVGPLNANSSVARSLRRQVSWNPNYVMTWHQAQYLKKFCEVSSGKTPVDLEGGDEQIKRISWVISAPEQAVREYYSSIRNRLRTELSAARRRRKKESEKQMELEAKASVMKKAQEAREQRVIEWEELLQRVHTGPLPREASARIKRIQIRFLQEFAGKDTQKWESEIMEAIRETDIISKKPSKPNRRTAPSSPTKKSTAPPLASNPPEKSIESLIAEQGPLAQSRPPPAKKKKKTASAAQGEVKKTPTRRHRFQWNRDYDELARDASAIIKARCRDAPRLDWGAYEQVFPAVPRNTVRQRVAHLREIPGNETYLNRLEDRWYELWLQHRGTEHLPDPDPAHATNFDLVKHIEFLRKHIDKNALRVGYAQPQHSVEVVIPNSVEQLLEQFDVAETSNAAPSWDFVWNATVEEGREKRLLSQPFITRLDELTFEDATSEVISLGESALKMTLGTPNEVYDPEGASRLLHSIGEETVATATRNLLGRGVLSKLVRDPHKPKPGRFLKISELNQNALGGIISCDVFQDAVSLEDLSLQSEGLWREWPLLAMDGDMAALMQLVSEDKVDFEIDTSQPQAARPALDWNSKKADDDQIETAIHVCFRDLAVPVGSSGSIYDQPSGMETGNSSTPSPAHGKTVDGNPGCCKQTTYKGVIDCSACLDESWVVRSATFTPAELELARLVLFLVGQAGEKGVTRQDLLVNIKVPEEELLHVIGKMTEEPDPFLYWIGYNSSFLISSAHLRFWTVSVSEDPMVRVFPRRWLDIFGSKISEVWEAALKAVIGAVVFRPGISQNELYWRLRSIYDRQEVIEILRTLYELGFIGNRLDPEVFSTSKLESRAIGALEEEEEKRVFWFIDESKHWYQI